MSKKVQPVRLEDLAKKLNVSKVTISKALRNHPDISKEMRMKVRQLSEDMAYVPNFLAKNLSARRSNIIGLVVPKIAHYFFGSVIESVYDTAFNKNYEILLTVSQEMAERERMHILSLLSMKVDGLIVSITQETKDIKIFEQVQKLNVPLVFIDRVPEVGLAPSVTVDDYGGSFEATEYFIKKGMHEIAHIGGYQYINIGKSRQDGFLDALAKHKVKISKQWVYEGGFAEEDGYKGFNAIIAKGKIPKAILAVTYPVALGIYKAAQEKGLRVPEDVQVTCFGSNEYNEMAPSLFNFVHQPAKKLGEEAVKLILSIINDPANHKNTNIELKTKLLIIGDKQKFVA